MKISNKAEEILETLWITLKEKAPLSQLHKRIRINRTNPAFRELIEKELITEENGKISFTKRGEREAENVIRRQRLAERLLTDVLYVKEDLEETACHLEHLLQKGIEENVCTLLGHPRLCPHGYIIPSGKCCQMNLQKTERIVCPLSILDPGQKGSIAYIYDESSHQIQKLISMGILPGKRIRLNEKSPSFIFQIDHTQIAVDHEIAQKIYVRIEKT